MKAPEPTRADLLALAKRMLLGLRPYASPGRARIVPPNGPGGYGADVCGLEGFARSAMLAAMVVAGAEGSDPEGFLDWYAAGLKAGVDPSHPERWVRPSEHAQAVVECFPLALTLELSRPWLWERLSSRTQEHVVAYLSEARAVSIPDNNWLWFVVTAETFLRSVGADWSASRVSSLLARSEDFYASDGWYRDGSGSQFDHYNDFAWHAIPLLWSTMRGARGVADELVPGYHQRAVTFLDDARHLIGGDGGPLIQGRSLVYRFAIAAPFWAAVMAGAPGVDPGMARRAGSALVGHFAERGVPDPDGILTLGWYGRWPRLVQSYSSTGSPYWASLGLLGLAMPATHPLWTAPAVPLPIEENDFQRVIRAPGWLVQGRAGSGLVQAVNHGTDHSRPGDLVTEAPLYGRLAYSTATWPAEGELSRDQSVMALDESGRPCERSGIETLWLRQRDDTMYGASRWRAHWIEAPSGDEHGGPGTGETSLGPWLSVASVVRDGVEVRIVTVDGPGDHRLRLSGWALPIETYGGARARLTVLASEALLTPGSVDLADVNPVDAAVRIDQVEGVVAGGATVVVALHGREAELPIASINDRTVAVTWPDGSSDDTTLPTVECARD